LNSLQPIIRTYSFLQVVTDFFFDLPPNPLSICHLLVSSNGSIVAQLHDQVSLLAPRQLLFAQRMPHVVSHMLLQPWSFSFIPQPPLLELNVQHVCRPESGTKIRRQQKQQQQQGKEGSNGMISAADFRYNVAHVAHINSGRGDSINSDNMFKGIFALNSICNHSGANNEIDGHRRHLLQFLHAEGGVGEREVLSAAIATDLSSCADISNRRYGRNDDDNHNHHQQQHSSKAPSILFFIAPPPPACPFSYCRHLPPATPHFHWSGPIISWGCNFQASSSSSSSSSSAAAAAASHVFCVPFSIGLVAAPPSNHRADRHSMLIVDSGGDGGKGGGSDGASSWGWGLSADVMRKAANCDG
jgi:hypothetical protein